MADIRELQLSFRNVCTHSLARRRHRLRTKEQLRCERCRYYHILTADACSIALARSLGLSVDAEGSIQQTRHNSEFSWRRVMATQFGVIDCVEYGLVSIRRSAVKEL
jgi:hypothetical protein